uniref:Lipase domain-containing protein n=1 Tax=Timema genevievae TaxID=629358 RepID=A0A7R9PS92_TIMGE|nr:unnamed protein product [Timema genevievae]
MIVNLDLVCYGELGCFSKSPPWHADLRPVPLPQTIEEIGTRFYQYSRQHTRRKYLTTWPSISLQGQNFDANKTTFFITHGFANTGNATWIRKLKNAILENVDGNVFLVGLWLTAMCPSWHCGDSLVSFQVDGNVSFVALW